MTIRSSMFLNDTTNIDYAYIDAFGMPIGGSYRPKFIVTGEVDPVENVVVDFSTIKKSLKAIIDDPNTGFDHKLWFIRNESVGDIVRHKKDQIIIETPVVIITAPKDIIRIMETRDEFNQYLESKLNEIYPNVKIDLKSTLTTVFDMHPNMNTDISQFRYVHGLKNSTSFGCQNPCHGHLSYMSADSSNSLATREVFKKIIKTINNKMFVWKDNIEITNGIINLNYSCARGEMHVKIGENQCIILNTETTIEHMCSYIAQTWREELLDSGVRTLFVSEGLSKGACLQLA